MTTSSFSISTIFPFAMLCWAGWSAADPPISSPGWTGRYFNGKDFQTLVGSRVDPVIDFNWSGSPFAGVPGDNFSVKWVGSVTPAFTETYTFYTATDNGVRVWINGKLVRNAWNPADGEEGGWDAFSVPLTAGQPATILCEYYQGWGGAEAQLYWTSASTPFRNVPTSSVSTLTTNVAPYLTPQLPQTTSQNSTVNTPAIIATDAEGDALSYSATGLPAGITLVKEDITGPQPNGQAPISIWHFTGSPTVSGVYTVNVKVSTPDLATQQESFLWTVSAPDNAATQGVLNSICTNFTARPTATGSLVNYTTPPSVPNQYLPILQTSTDLVSWNNSPTQPTITGNSYSYSLITPGSGRQFFRVAVILAKVN